MTEHEQTDSETREMPTVYRLHSTVEVRLESVYDHFEDATLPPAVDDVDITRRNNTLVIGGVPTDQGISKYTPTAQLKATVSEKRVYEDSPDPSGATGLQWQARDPDVEEPVGELVEFAGFKGTLETVLLNSELQYPMFEVLCDLARLAERGQLTAIAGVDGELEAVRIVDGEERQATLEVVEEEGDADADGVNWRDNEFIQ